LLGRYVSYSNPHAESFRHILDDGFRPVGPKSTLDLVVRDSSSTPLRIVVTIAQMPSQTIIACKLIVVALPYRYIDMRDCE
jgi:hypothetical protein